MQQKQFQGEMYRNKQIKKYIEPQFIPQGTTKRKTNYFQSHQNERNNRN